MDLSTNRPYLTQRLIDATLQHSMHPYSHKMIENQVICLVACIVYF